MNDIQVGQEALAPEATDLTDKQRAFAEQYVAMGGNGTEAAVAAGYAHASAASQASRMLRNPKIQNTILRETMNRMGMQAPRALMTVTTLMSTARSDYVKLQAAQDLLDRAGFRPPDRVDHRVDANLTVSFDIAPDPKIIAADS